MQSSHFNIFGIKYASERCPLRKITSNRDCWNVYRFSCFFQDLFEKKVLLTKCYHYVRLKLRRITTATHVAMSTHSHRNNFSSSKTSSRHLENVLQRHIKDVLKDESCYADDIFKMSSTYFWKMPSRRLGDKQNVYWRYLYPTNLNLYLTNPYLTNLYLTNLKRIYNSLIRTKQFRNSSYFESSISILKT